MIATPHWPYTSPENYLAIERGSSLKHEYRCGQMYAMVGAKKPHVVLAANIARLLGTHLVDRPCLVMVSDMKVHLEREVYRKVPLG